MNIQPFNLYPLVGSLIGDAMVLSDSPGQSWSYHSAAALATAVGLLQNKFNEQDEHPGGAFYDFGCVGQQLEQLNKYMPTKEPLNQTETWNFNDPNNNQGLNLIGIIYMCYCADVRNFQEDDLLIYPKLRSIALLISNHNEIFVQCAWVIMMMFINLRRQQSAVSGDSIVTYIQEHFKKTRFDDQVKNALLKFNSLDGLSETSPLFSLRLLCQCLQHETSFLGGIARIKRSCVDIKACAMNGAIYGQVAGALYQDRGIPVEWITNLPFRSMIGFVTCALTTKMYKVDFQVTDWTKLKPKYQVLRNQKGVRQRLEEQPALTARRTVIDFYLDVMTDKQPKTDLIESFDTETKEVEENEFKVIQTGIIEFKRLERFLVTDINETVRSWETGTLNLGSDVQKQNFLNVAREMWVGIKMYPLLKKLVSPDFLVEPEAASVVSSTGLVAGPSAGPRQLTSVKQSVVQSGLDVIVNAANPYVQDGGGVTGAIFKEAGRSALSNEIQQLKPDIQSTPLNASEVLTTQAHGLNKHGTKFIIHAVGPNFNLSDYNQNLPRGYEALKNTYKNMYREMDKLQKTHSVTTIGVVPISSSIYAGNAPKDRLYKIMVDETLEAMAKYPLIKPVLYLFDQKEYDKVNEILAEKNRVPLEAVPPPDGGLAEQKQEAEDLRQLPELLNMKDVYKFVTFMRLLERNVMYDDAVEQSKLAVRALEQNSVNNSDLFQKLIQNLPVLSLVEMVSVTSKLQSSVLKDANQLYVLQQAQSKNLLGSGDLLLIVSGLLFSIDMPTLL
jgi:O-acetyl-ADP-ribose deacetylase (regulator of RNase III)